MTIKTTLLAVSAAALIAGSVFSAASAGDNSIVNTFHGVTQDGFINSDGSAVAQHATGYGYSTNKSPVSKLSNVDATYENQPTSSADR